MGGFSFPGWTDRMRPLLGGMLIVAPVYAVAILYYGGSPQTTDVGYAPEQPIPYSHALHAGELGIDCRYCHTTVEKAPHAAIPPTQVCMNCHAQIATDSVKLLPLREAYANGDPLHWVRVHDLPDYVYFDHSAHVTRGVSCVACHGRVDRMQRVSQVATLSMGWCLDCHRNPDLNLRPREFVTKLDWTPNEDPLVLGKRIRAENNINPSTDCSTCHR
jgi:hypothetical protein